MFGLGHFEALVILKLGIPVVLIYMVVRGYRQIIGRLDQIEERLRRIEER
jgi:hypothetical protein